MRSRSTIIATLFIHLYSPVGAFMPDGLKRLHHSGQSHFLTFSRYHRLPLLAQMRMEEAFLLALEQVRRRFALRVYGYVVMPEHTHLLVSEPAENRLAKAVQLLKMKVSLEARKQGQRAAGESAFWQGSILRSQRAQPDRLRYPTSLYSPQSGQAGPVP